MGNWFNSRPIIQVSRLGFIGGFGCSCIDLIRFVALYNHEQILCPLPDINIKPVRNLRLPL